MPKRLSAAQRRGEQLLLRVTTEELGWLESAAHLDRRSVNTYVYLLLQAHVASLASNQYVRADRENRRAYDRAKTQAIQLPTAQRSADTESSSTLEHETDAAT